MWCGRPSLGARLASWVVLAPARGTVVPDDRWRLFRGRRKGRGQGGGRPGPPIWGRRLRVRIRVRRTLVGLVACAVWGGLCALAWGVLGQTPWSPRKAVMLVCLIGMGAWPGLCVANGVIGFLILLMARDPVRATFPGLAAADSGWVPRARCVLALTVRREDMGVVLPRLRRLLDGLDTTPARDAFAAWVLSDTPAGPEADAEAQAVAAFRAADRDPPRIGYRRRMVNTGFKAGNLMAFFDAEGTAFETALVLDADSQMAPRAVLRLLRALEDDPRLGLVQHLTVGAPASIPLPRLFQFGMRAGMRVWAVGQAWWQDDAGPYWGHNAALRIAPFRRHARLPLLPDGRAILSHDQVEAALLRAAGWGVRVLAEEDGSQEDNPPALPEFIRRDLRWMAGNLQYRHLLRRPGFLPMGRWQLLQAILLFAGAPLQTAMVVLSALGVAAGDVYPAGPVAWAVAAWLGALHAPKLLGYAQVAAVPRERARYGGLARLLAGAALEGAFSLALDAVMGVTKTLGMARLALGGQAGWLAQNRSGRGVTWEEAARLLWPQTLVGVAVIAACLRGGAGGLAWALLLAGGMAGAVPFCVVTSSGRLGAWLARTGTAAVPEELVAPEPGGCADAPALRRGRAA
jgi:membrane glycosyltransferase